MKPLTWCASLVVAGALLASCAPEGGSTGGGGAPAGNTPAPSTAGAASDPKAAVVAQLEALKAGDVEKLKAGLTARLRDDITAKMVEEAKAEAGGTTIDDLYASVEMGQDGGKQTATVKMKNGRTLTTLIEEEDGKWQADTIWFR